MNEKALSKTPYFDKQTTDIIKGIALIMMFIHHFFTFPEWWLEEISYPLIEKTATYFCIPLQLCVPIFCFITGYFYFFNKNRTYKYSLKKISDILISYWCVFFIFAIIAILFVHFDYTIKGFILECFALQRPTMCFCWYVIFYISFMLLLPLVTKIMSHNIHIDLIISLAIIPLLLRIIEHFVNNSACLEIIDYLLSWFSIVLMGYIYASFKIFERIEKINHYIVRNKVVNLILMVIILLFAIMWRKEEPTVTLTFTILPSLYINLDIIYAPISIYAIVNIFKNIKIKQVKNILSVIGKYSLLMWFVSCLFYGNCKQIFQQVLYFPHEPLLVLIWGLILCFIVSYLLNIVISKIQKKKDELFFKAA